jgi:hypothetical protein
MRPLAIAAACSVVAISLVSFPVILLNKKSPSSTTKISTSIRRGNHDPQMHTQPALQDHQPVAGQQAQEKHVASITVKPSAKKNVFVYHPSQSKSFTASQGTQVWIPDHAFVDAQTGRPVTTEVAVKIEEYYTMDDIILNGLHTMSDKGLLETNGMIYMNASANGRECKLDENKTAIIGFPMLNDKPDMQLFWKDRDDINSVWQAGEFTRNVYIPIPADGKEIPPSLRNGPASLKYYINSYIVQSVDKWNGKMEVEIYVTPLGTTDSVKVLNEINDDATAQIGIALKKLNWQKGFKGLAPASFRARLQFEYVRDRGLSNVKFTQPFTYAPYVIPKETQFRRFATPQLGWINVDRFMLYTNKTDFKVDIDDSYLDVKIIFDKYKAIMNGKSDGVNYVFNDVPKDEVITVIAIKKQKGNYLLAMEQTNTSAGTLTDLEFKTTAKDQIKTALLSLDKISKPITAATAMR